MENMQPPQWVVDKIAEVYPKARLGFCGGTHYALCELWRVREESVIGRDFDGHLYGADYDKLFFRPRHIIDVAPEHVFSGAVVDHVRTMLTSFKDRQLAKLQAAGKAEDDELQDMAEEQGHELYMQAQRSYHRPQVVAKKFLTNDDRAVLSGEAADSIDIANSYMPTPGQGSAIK